MRGGARVGVAALLAILLSLISVLVTYQISQRVFDGMPHLEDEFAYIWEARTIAGGHILLPSPPHPGSFLVPFVVDFQGTNRPVYRFGKYPPGWPLVLALGVKAGLRAWVNPLLGGLAVWLTYLLGRRLFTDWIGLLAAGLTASSPFFLMNSSVLLSHPLGLVLSIGFALAWLEAFGRPIPLSPGSPSHSQNSRRLVDSPALPALAGGVLMGLLALTRPLTAIGVALPFGMHGLYLLWRSDRQTRMRLFLFGLTAGAVAGLLFFWQYLLTGDPWLNPYTLWWPYDKIGFGPGFGVTTTGHNLQIAYQNMKVSLAIGAFDLFGWGPLSCIFLPFGLWAVRRQRQAWLVGGVFPAIVILYMAYWIGSYLFGPRYYYEGLFSLTLLSAAGIAWLAGWPLTNQPAAPRPARDEDRRRWRKLRPILTTAGLLFFVSLNLIYYLPIRLNALKDLYGISRESLAPFLTAEAQALTPALIIVHTDNWREFGAMIDLEDPALTTPFIFAWNMDPETDAEVAASFPGRLVFHYYPAEPYKFYANPKP